MELYGSDLKNISMTRGDSESLTVKGLSLVNGDAIYMTVRTNVNTARKELFKEITEFVNGEAVIGITPEDTNNLRFSTYVYDIQLTRADGTVTTIIKPHEFKVEGEVTYD
jgi:hypothetical protein